MPPKDWMEIHRREVKKFLENEKKNPRPKPRVVPLPHPKITHQKKR